MSQWILANGLAASAAVAGGLAVSLPYVAPAFVWVPWAWFLGASVVLVTRRVTRVPALGRLIGLSFAIRCALAVALFAISWLKLPLFPSLQLHSGLWAFGGDGGGYHEQALGILDAWRSGIELNSIFMGGAYAYRGPALLMAVVYGVIGPSPLHFMLVNAWVGAMSAVLAYMLAICLGDRRSACAAALLVAFWPSSIMWSTQLMKDSIHVGLLMWALLLLVVLWQRYSSGVNAAARAVWFDAVYWIGLAMAVFGVTYLRTYLGLLLTISVGLVMGVAFARAVWRGRLNEVAAATALTVTVGVATLAGASVDLHALFSPRYPEVGHVKRGDAFRSRQQVELALASYRRAIALNPKYAPAHLALALTLLEQGDRAAAVDELSAYLRLESDKRRREEAVAVFPCYQDPQNEFTGDDSHAKNKPDLIVKVDPNRVSGVLSRVIVALRTPLFWASVTRLDDLRRIQVTLGGASVIDADARFHTAGDLIAYMPKALANAYLTPYPWQWLFTRGANGIMRPLAGVEVVVIFLLIPAILVGCWQRASRFRPEEWMLIAFVGVLSFGIGLMMPNIGTLFRLRLQFLVPALILASSALPAFVYRLVDRLLPPASAPA